MGQLPEIPVSYLVGLLLIAMVAMRAFGIDSWTTAALSSISGYILGKHTEQTRRPTPIVSGTTCQEGIKK